MRIALIEKITKNAIFFFVKQIKTVLNYIYYSISFLIKQVFLLFEIYEYLISKNFRIQHIKKKIKVMPLKNILLCGAFILIF